MEDTIHNALTLIQQHNLGKAIRIIRNILTEKPYLADLDILEDIEHSYHLMLDFMQRGYKDDRREDLYYNLLRKLFMLASDMENTWKMKNTSPYVEAAAIARNINRSHDFIKNVLESFVTDITLLSLDGENVRKQKGMELHQRHQLFMNQLFNSVWTSGQWTGDDRSFYTELLLSPTVSTNDTLLLTSAITLGAINTFDLNKLLTLIDVYRNTADERTRQRALAGFAFSLPTADIIELFPELAEVTGILCGNKDILRELLELQIQVFYCLNAEKDNNQIQKDIIPTLIKNNNLHVTRFGITEKEEDPMQDILYPDQADQAMEEVENSIQKMIDMQKAGSDIYFGGFSQMKRFPFFSTMSNWFCPFYAEHPALRSVNAKLDGNPFIKLLFKSGPFCDSDKYSFAIAMSGIMDKIPGNMREMMGNAEALGPVAAQEEMQTPAYIRRMYLQDLYRFYKLYPGRTGLENPFEHAVTATGDFTNNRAFFFLSPLLNNGKLTEYKIKLGKFLMKQHRWSEINALIMSFNGNIPYDNVEYYLLSAYADMNDNLYGLSIEMFNKAISIESENTLALKGLARAYMMEGGYAQAEAVYSTLTKYFPDNKNFKLNHCITLLKTDRADEAMETLYKLDYENPNDLNIKRVLAWGLLCQNKLEQAKKEYTKILADAPPKKEDYLNAGYCAWFMGDIAHAIELFRLFTNEDIDGRDNRLLEHVFSEDHDIIHKYGITYPEIQLMIDLVEEG